MNNNPITLKHITNEKDLAQYRDFLNNDSSKKKTTINNFLNDCIGEFLQLDFLLGNRLETKKGILKSVENSFIILENPYNKTNVACSLNFLVFAKKASYTPSKSKGGM